MSNHVSCRRGRAVASTAFRRSSPLLAALALLVSTGCASSSTSPTVPAPGDDSPASAAAFTRSGVLTSVLRAGEAGAWVRTPCFAVAWAPVARVVTETDVLLDPGHGGAEDGAVGPNGLREKDINATIAQLVAGRLLADGFRVELTHRRDDTVSLQSRGELARALRPRVMVSIHHNSLGEPLSDHPGTQAIHQVRSAHARRLAELLFQSVQPAIDDFPITWMHNAAEGVGYRVGEHGDYYGVLRYSAGVPTAIIEASIISNPAEADLMRDAAYQRAEATGIANGIEAYLRDVPRDAPDATLDPPVEVTPSTTPTGARANDDDDAPRCVDPDLERTTERP